MQKQKILVPVADESRQVNISGRALQVAILPEYVRDEDRPTISIKSGRRKAKARYGRVIMSPTPFDQVKVIGTARSSGDLLKLEGYPKPNEVDTLPDSLPPNLKRKGFEVENLGAPEDVRETSELIPSGRDRPVFLQSLSASIDGADLTNGKRVEIEVESQVSVNGSKKYVPVAYGQYVVRTQDDRFISLDVNALFLQDESVRVRFESFGVANGGTIDYRLTGVGYIDEHNIIPPR